MTIGLEYKIIDNESELLNCKSFINSYYRGLNRDLDLDNEDILNSNDKVLIGGYEDDRLVSILYGYIKDLDLYKVGIVNSFLSNSKKTYAADKELYRNLNDKFKKWCEANNCKLIINDGRQKNKETTEIIFSDCLDCKIPLSKVYEIYNKHGESVESFIHRNIYNGKDEEYITRMHSKKIYENCFSTLKKRYNGEITVGELSDIIENSDMDEQSFYQLGFIYAKKVLKMDDKEIQIMNQKVNIKRNILDSIENTSDELEVEKILNEYARYNEKGIDYGNKKIDSLYGSIFGYVISKYGDRLSNDEHNLLVKLLKEKISNVRSKYLKIKKDEKAAMKVEKNEKHLLDILKESEYLVINFMESNISLKNYLEKNNISRSSFEKALESIKENNIELYNKYNDYINQKKSQNYAVLMSEVDNIINSIKNGVVNEETNKKRDFDILDYYISTNLKPDDFLQLVNGKYDNNDLRVIRTFFAKNKCEKK